MQPFSKLQLQCAALDALMSVRVFWGMLLGRRVSSDISYSHVQAKVKKFVGPVCKTMSISQVVKEKRMTTLKQEGLYSKNIWESSRQGVENSSRSVSHFNIQLDITSSVSTLSLAASDETLTTTGLAYSGDIPSLRKERQVLKPSLKDLYEGVPRLPPLEIKHDSNQLYQKPLKIRSSLKRTDIENSAETLSPMTNDWNLGWFQDVDGVWGKDLGESH